MGHAVLLLPRLSLSLSGAHLPLVVRGGQIGACHALARAVASTLSALSLTAGLLNARVTDFPLIHFLKFSISGVRSKPTRASASTHTLYAVYSLSYNRSGMKHGVGEATHARMLVVTRGSVPFRERQHLLLMSAAGKCHPDGVAQRRHCPSVSLAVRMCGIDPRRGDVGAGAAGESGTPMRLGTWWW